MSGRLGTTSAAVLLVLVLALGACGRKGDLRPPDSEEDAYTGLGVYPAPESVVPSDEESLAVPEDEESPETSEEGAANP